MFQSKEHNQVAANFAYLSVLQAANYILPLIIIPYLIRVIGIEYFGRLSFATAVVMYFYVIVDYGFNLTATKAVSLNRGDTYKLTEIYSSVVTAKFILMLIGVVVLAIFVFTAPKLAENWEIYFLTYGIVLGQVLFPVWMFQGMEKMWYITIINVVSKTIFTIAVFIFVNEKEDYYLVPLLISSGAILAGVWSIYLVKDKFNVSFELQSIPVVKGRFVDGWHVFISNIFTCVYTISITFFLGVFTNDTVVGFYSIAEKIVKGIGYLFVPVNDALFPYISKLVSTSPGTAVNMLNRLCVFSAVVMGFISILLFYYSDVIIRLVAGSDSPESSLLLKILALHPLVLTLSRIFANNYLVNFDFQAVLSKIYMYTSILSLFVIFSLIPAYQGAGAGVAIMIVESFAMLLMFREIRKNIFNKSLHV